MRIYRILKPLTIKGKSDLYFGALCYTQGCDKERDDYDATASDIGEEKTMEKLGLPTNFNCGKRKRQHDAADTLALDIGCGHGVWLQLYDPKSTHMYYSHSLTGERTWQPPGQKNFVPYDWLSSPTWRASQSSDGTDETFSLDALDEGAADPSAAARLQAACPNSARKYWYQRYRIFSRFAEGVSMDDGSWFDTTPEAIARHHASRMKGLCVLDCFCGVGGNVIQFAHVCDMVLAADVDNARVHKAFANAKLYGVSNAIDFTTADALSFLRSVRKGYVDTVFLSPPWGGPAYSMHEDFDVTHLEPVGLEELLRVSLALAPEGAAVFLPRNTRMQAMVDCIPNGVGYEVIPGSKTLSFPQRAFKIRW